MDSRYREELIREYPLNLWIIGVLFITGGIFSNYRAMPVGLLIGGVSIGLLMLLLSTVLIVELGDSRRTLLLKRIGIIRRKIDEIPVREIQSVFVQQSRTRDRNSSASYRVVIRMQEGEIFPLRTYYSSGAQAKEKTAQQIRLAIGVGGTDQTNLGVFEMASQLVQGAYQENGKMLGELEEQETNGVRWQMDTIALGASPVTRWLSKEFVYPDQFLYLAQKIEGQDSGKKLIALMGKTLMRQSLQMYGFSDEDTPNFDDAEVLDSVDLRLDEHFLCYTSDALGAKNLLSSWAAAQLADWAERHPLRQGVNQTDNFSQLVILFSPNGVYLCCLGELKDSETDELVNLGVELVKAQSR